MKKQQELRLPAFEVKIFKRYSFRIILTSLLALAMIGLCVAMLFLPLVTFTTVTSSGNVEYPIKGWDIIIDFFQGNDGRYSGLLKYIGQLGSNATIEAGLLRNIVNVFFISTPIFFLVIGFHAIFLAIFALKGLFYGKLNNYKGCTSFSRAIVFCILFISGVVIAYNFLLPNFTKNNVNVSKDILYSYIYMGGALVLWVIIHAIYYIGLKDGYLDKYVKKVEDDEPTIVNNYAPLESKKKKNSEPEVVPVSTAPAVGNAPSAPNQDGQQAIGLPANLSKIGGHAFTANMNLRLAVIPEGIPSIGDGAFANCGNLTLLSIPKSCKSIGANAFFNCQNLKRINYAGSKTEWSKIVRGSNWLFQGGTNIIVCIDGTIVVDPLS